MDFWKGKRIIVTGGAGFLGSFVVEKLHAKGASDVIVPRKAKYNLVNQADIKRMLVDTSINGKPVDIIIHLAASVGGIGANLSHQADYFYENLMMGTQLMHEAYTYKVDKFVAIGTICAYPKFAPIPFLEEDIWNGYPEETNAPYGLAKKMMLVQSQVYRSQYGFNSIYLLPVNLYGPRDNFDLETSHVIPALVRKCLEAKDRGDKFITAWGDGSPTREFLYVEDAAEAIILATEKYNDSEPVNLGSSYEVSIKELVETVAKATQFDGEIRWDTNRPNGQPRRKLDVQRAKDYFGFSSQVSFEEGLKKTVEWYRNNKSK